MSNANEPAFPVTDFTVPHGMSKRELIAMHALQGWIAGPLGGDTMDVFDFEAEPEVAKEHLDAVASTCVAYADALLAELSKAVPQ
jgi:hypothetical protein